MWAHSIVGTALVWALHRFMGSAQHARKETQRWRRFWVKPTGDYSPMSQAEQAVVAYLFGAVPLSTLALLFTYGMSNFVNFPIGVMKALWFYPWVMCGMSWLLMKVAPHDSPNLFWKMVLGWPGEAIVLGSLGVLFYAW